MEEIEREVELEEEAEEREREMSARQKRKDRKRAAEKQRKETKRDKFINWEILRFVFIFLFSSLYITIDSRFVRSIFKVEN